MKGSLNNVFRKNQLIKINEGNKVSQLINFIIDHNLENSGKIKICATLDREHRSMETA